MTETTRSLECSAATFFLALELGSTKWTLAFSPSMATRPRLRTIAAGDVVALQREIERARERFGLPRETLVWSCYEAGRDGFWLHRWLVTQGIRNLVAIRRASR